MPTLTPIFPAYATLLPQRVVVSAVWAGGAVLNIPNAVQIPGPAGPAGAQGEQGEAGGVLGELALSVETTGQAQFNVFTAPVGAHWLLVNGVAFRPPSYSLVTVSGNLKLNWSGPFVLDPNDDLLFVTL